MSARTAQWSQGRLSFLSGLSSEALRGEPASGSGDLASCVAPSCCPSPTLPSSPTGLVTD